MTDPQNESAAKKSLENIYFMDFHPTDQKLL